MDELMASIGQTENEQELYALLSPYSGRQLSIRFMVSLLSWEPDWQRSLAILDWINDKALYTPSVFAYNVVLHCCVTCFEQSSGGLHMACSMKCINVFGKAKLFQEARLLLKEMREVGVRPDTVSYSTLLTIYVENQKFVEALSIFSEINVVKCPLDLTTCNVMIDVYGQLDMVKEADRLFWSMRKIGIEPNVVSYNTLLRVCGEAELFGEAIHLFRLM
ncbi:hypothetical protein K1719_002531 [Acacia pycnantha]|nr:hypothetical protein K1719_002531 [Acacia pycnantha]